MIWGAGYPNEVQVSVVMFSHLTTATGFSVSGGTTEKKQLLTTDEKLLASVLFNILS